MNFILTTESEPTHIFPIDHLAIEIEGAGWLHWIHTIDWPQPAFHHHWIKLWHFAIDARFYAQNYQLINYTNIKYESTLIDVKCWRAADSSVFTETPICMRFFFFVEVRLTTGKENPQREREKEILLILSISFGRCVCVSVRVFRSLNVSDSSQITMSLLIKLRSFWLPKTR